MSQDLELLDRTLHGMVGLAKKDTPANAFATARVLLDEYHEGEWKRLGAAFILRDLQDRTPHGEWQAQCKKHIPQYKERYIRDLVRIAREPDPVAALRKEQARVRLAVAANAAKKKEALANAGQPKALPAPHAIDNKKALGQVWDLFHEGREHLPSRIKSGLFNYDRSDKHAGQLNQELEYYRMYGGFEGTADDWAESITANVKHIALVTPKTFAAEKDAAFAKHIETPAVPEPVEEKPVDIFTILDGMDPEARYAALDKFCDRYITTQEASAPYIKLNVSHQRIEIRLIAKPAAPKATKTKKEKVTA